MYSTPSIYTQYINKENSVKWNVKTDDFFPYADSQWGYWTGNYPVIITS